jgi:hypothetical protein
MNMSVRESACSGQEMSVGQVDRGKGAQISAPFEALARLVAEIGAQGG